MSIGFQNRSLSDHTKVSFNRRVHHCITQNGFKFNGRIRVLKYYLVCWYVINTKNIISAPSLSSQMYCPIFSKEVNETRWPNFDQHAERCTSMHVLKLVRFLEKNLMQELDITLLAMIAFLAVQSSTPIWIHKCYFIHRYLNSVWHNNAYSLLGMLRLTIITSNVLML